MSHEKRPYYVGLLKAAELHGSSHQAVMEFQVVTDKRLPQIRVGRSSIAFYYRKEIDALESGIETHKTDTGTMKLSSVELTMLDLLRYPYAGGGLDNISTILSDLGARIQVRKLASLAVNFERSVIQRLGYLLDRFGHRKRAEPLQMLIAKNGAPPWVELEPQLAADADVHSEIAEKNSRWHVVVRRYPKPDE